MSESLLVGSKTRAALKANGVNVGGGALDALNEVVHWYIDQASKRAAANRRKTVRPHDFIVIDTEEARAAESTTPAESHAQPAAVAESLAAPPAPAAPQAEFGSAPFGGDPAPAPATDVDAADGAEAEEEAAPEAPPPAWSG